MWALGVTLYWLVYACAPFGGSATSMPELMRLIQEDEWAPKGDVAAEDAQLIALIGKLLEKDVEKRPNLRDLWDDPWLTKDSTVPMPATTGEEGLDIAMTLGQEFRRLRKRSIHKRVGKNAMKRVITVTKRFGGLQLRGGDAVPRATTGFTRSTAANQTQPKLPS